MTISHFRLCIKDSAGYEGQRSNIIVDYLVIGGMHRILIREHFVIELIMKISEKKLRCFEAIFNLAKIDGVRSLIYFQNGAIYLADELLKFSAWSLFMDFSFNTESSENTA